MNNNWDEYRNKIIGLGENSFKKSYYPELQSKIEELEASKSNLETIFNSASDAILIHDQSGNMLEMNHPGHVLFNIKPEDVSKYTVFDISSDKNDKNRLAYFWKEVTDKGSITTEWIARQIGTDREIHVQVSVNRSFWNKQKVFVAVVRDFTERKEYEQKLVAALEKAEESDKLKTAFLQNISHEVRTPLNAIAGFSGLLSEPGLPSEKRDSFVQIIQKSSNQLISIITNILTISSLETHQEEVSLKKVCINHILDDLLLLFNHQPINQEITLHVEKGLDDQQSEVLTDGTKVTQILTNLLSNALKFTHYGSVEFGYTVVQDNTKFSMEFYVRDTGIGISPENYERIFERFRQAHKSIHKLYGGTGLGLAISKAFVELLGGQIWVQSEPDKGSTFFFRIPYNPVVKSLNVDV